MPNQRSKKQKGVLVMMDEDFLAEIDAALPHTGHGDRSKFIRAAVYKDLKQRGIDLPVEITSSPDRKGKGGKPSHKTNKTRVKVKKNFGTMNVVGKKSTSTYTAPGPKDAQHDWRMNEDPPNQGKKKKPPEK